MVATKRVFVVYAHEADDGHRANVARLVDVLTAAGLDVHYDGQQAASRPDWDEWAEEMIQKADFVLLVTSRSCLGTSSGPRWHAEANRGLRSELHILRQLIAEDPERWRRKVLPVILPGSSANDIPLFIGRWNRARFVLPTVSEPSVIDLVAAIEGTATRRARPAPSRSDEALTPAVVGEVVRYLTPRMADYWAQEQGRRWAEGRARSSRVRVRWGRVDGFAPGHVGSALPPDGYADELLDVYRLGGDVGRLVLIGAPGAGKTTTMIELMLAVASSPDRGADVAPVFLSLGTWNPEEPFSRWASGMLQRDHNLPLDLFGPDPVRALMDAGRVALFLDGLDEMPAAQRQAALDRLDLETAGVRVVLTSRPGEYREAARVGRFYDSVAVELLPVDAAAAGAYLTDGQYPADQLAWDSLAEHLADHPGSPAAEALSTPLTLSLARLAYRTGDPGELTAFGTAGDVREHLFSRFLESAYDNEAELAQARRWLSWIAYHLDSERDLFWWQIPTWQKKFPLFTRAAPVAALAFIAVYALIAVLAARADSDGPSLGLTLAVGCYLGATFGTMLVDLQALSPPVGTLPLPAALEWFTMGTLGAFGWGVVVMVTGIDVRQLGSSDLSEAESVLAPFLVALILAIFVAGPSALGAALLARVRRAPGDTERVSVGVTADLRPTARAVAVAVATSSFVLVLLWWLSGRPTSAVITTFWVLGVLLLAGLFRRPSFAVLLTGWVLGVGRGGFPRLLDRAYDRQVLRRVGVAHQFRHADLQEYLARSHHTGVRGPAEAELQLIASRLAVAMTRLWERRLVNQSGAVDLMAPWEEARPGTLLVLGPSAPARADSLILLMLRILEGKEGTPGPVPVWLQASTWRPEEESLRVWVTARAEFDHPHLAGSRSGLRQLNELLRTRRLVIFIDGLEDLPALQRVRALRRIDAEAAGLSVVASCDSAEFAEASAILSGFDAVVTHVAVEETAPTTPDLTDDERFWLAWLVERAGSEREFYWWDISAWLSTRAWRAVLCGVMVWCLVVWVLTNGSTRGVGAAVVFPGMVVLVTFFGAIGYRLTRLTPQRWPSRATFGRRSGLVSTPRTDRSAEWRYYITMSLVVVPICALGQATSSWNTAGGGWDDVWRYPLDAVLMLTGFLILDRRALLAFYLAPRIFGVGGRRVDLARFLDEMVARGVLVERGVGYRFRDPALREELHVEFTGAAGGGGGVRAGGAWRGGSGARGLHG